jgi:hypothetical protein
MHFYSTFRIFMGSTCKLSNKGQTSQRYQKDQGMRRFEANKMRKQVDWRAIRAKVRFDESNEQSDCLTESAGLFVIENNEGRAKDD